MVAAKTVARKYTARDIIRLQKYFVSQTERDAFIGMMLIGSESMQYYATPTDAYDGILDGFTTATKAKGRKIIPFLVLNIFPSSMTTSISALGSLYGTSITFSAKENVLINALTSVAVISNSVLQAPGITFDAMQLKGIDVFNAIFAEVENLF